MAFLLPVKARQARILLDSASSVGASPIYPEAVGQRPDQRQLVTAY